MTTQSHFVAYLIVTLFLSQPAFGLEPELSSHFPKLAENWTAVAYEKASSFAPWHYDVYANSKNGDLLSFAARRVPAGESRPLIYWSDTSREVFSIGHPAVTRTSSPPTTSRTFRNDVVQLKAIAALEYTLVVEVPGEQNRMVQGYTFIVDDVAYFVHHTATTPITEDLARNTAKSLISAIRKGGLKPLQ